MKPLILGLEHSVSKISMGIQRRCFTRGSILPSCTATPSYMDHELNMEQEDRTGNLTVGSDPFTTSTEGNSDKGLSDARHSLICFALQRCSFSVVLLCRSWLRSEYHR